MKTAIYPGTFDPITVGHVDIIQRALPIVDRLIIGVALDTGKDPTFDLETRVALVEQEIRQLGAAAGRIKVKSFPGLLVDFAAEMKANFIIRGLRAVSDFEYEFQMACMNARMKPDIETVFLPASENTHFISSRFVKQIARLGGDISSVVSPKVARALKKHYKEKRD